MVRTGGKGRSALPSMLTFSETVCNALFRSLEFQSDLTHMPSEGLVPWVKTKYIVDEPVWGSGSKLSCHRGYLSQGDQQSIEAKKEALRPYKLLSPSFLR